jgi:hypothetical protein
VAIAPSQIQGALDALDQQIPQSAAEKCAVLLGELDKWNRKVNLTAIRDPEEMITGHLLDSLVARPFLVFPACRWPSWNRSGNSPSLTATTRRSSSCSMSPRFSASATLLL